ncbi:MAG: hypothetical protein QM805_23305 [Pseudomonas sp.]
MACFNLSDKVQLKVDPYFVRVTDGTAAVAVVPVNENNVNADLNGDGDTLDPLVTGALSVYPTPVPHRLHQHPGLPGQ